MKLEVWKEDSNKQTWSGPESLQCSVVLGQSRMTATAAHNYLGMNSEQEKSQKIM